MAAISDDPAWFDVVPTTNLCPTGRKMISAKSQGSQIIRDRFGPTNQFYSSISFKQQLLWAQPGVVLKPHRMAMGTGIVDRQDISFFDAGKLALYRKLIVVFAQRTNNIVELISRFAFFTDNVDMMIGVIHTRTHEGRHAGVNTNIVAIDVFMINRPSQQTTMGAGHKATTFHVHFRDITVSLFKGGKNVANFTGHSGKI